MADEKGPGLTRTLDQEMRTGDKKGYEIFHVL